jgi:nucleotide-binding universal stress UspA family protein
VQEAAMIRKILCATDLSPASEPALRSALDLGRRLDALVYVLHLVDPPYRAVPWFVPAPLDQEFLKTLSEKQEQAALDEIKRLLAELMPPPGAVEAMARTGPAVDGILAAASDVGADLIVVGTHGRTGIRHLALGSVAERIVRSAAVPVLTVRRRS